MRRTLIRSLIVTAALVIAPTACSGDAEPAPNAQSKGTAKSVTIAISSDEGTLTPFTNQTGYPGNNLVKLIFDPLAVVRGDDVVPLLAKEIKTTDNKVYTLPLRAGVTWHDGKPLTADDVVFSVEFYRKNMEGDSAIDVRPIASVTANGDAVTMTLKAADPEFPRRILADMAILPKHVWQSVTKVSTAGADKAIGTGPYKLTKYDNARGYTLTANASYALGKPRVETVKVVVIPEESTQFAALRTGEIQLSSRIVPPQQLAALEKQPNIGVVKGTEFASTLLAFNSTRLLSTRRRYGVRSPRRSTSTTSSRPRFSVKANRVVRASSTPTPRSSRSSGRPSTTWKAPNATSTNWEPRRVRTESECSTASRRRSSSWCRAHPPIDSAAPN